MQTATLIVPVDNDLQLQTENGQVVVSSRVVAERFGKEHRKVVRAIENKIESLTVQNCPVKNLFIESTYMHNGNKYKEYLLTRDGFTFIVMGFTGAEADIWKLKYIEAFNKMEQALKEQNQSQSMSMEDIIIYQMQQSKLMKEQLEKTQTVAIEAKATAEQVNKSLQTVKNVMLFNRYNWDTECNILIYSMAHGCKEYAQKIKEEVYQLVEERGRANLKQRIANKQHRLRVENANEVTINNVDQLNVIADDPRLKEIYIGYCKRISL